MIEPSHTSVRSWDQWSLGGDNNNCFDRLRKGQSLVCIRELKVVVYAASTCGLKSVRSSRLQLTLDYTGALVDPLLLAHRGPKLSGVSVHRSPKLLSEVTTAALRIRNPQ